MTLPDNIRYMGKNTDGLHVYHIADHGFWVAPAHLKITTNEDGTLFHYQYCKEKICRYFDPRQHVSFMVALRSILVVIKNRHGLFKRRLDARWFFGNAGTPKRGYKNRLYFHLHIPPSLRQIYPDLPKNKHRSFKAKDKDGMHAARAGICQCRRDIIDRFTKDFSYHIKDVLAFTTFDDHITYMDTQ